MKNKKGFTLTEFMLTITVLLVIVVVVLPTILFVIKKVRIEAFKNSAYSVLDSVSYYLTDEDYKNIPDEGLSIDELDLDLKNNNFDTGIVTYNNQKKLELVELTRDNFCAKGIKDKIVVSDQGCGGLDTTAPKKALLYLQNRTSTSLTVVASGIDLESDIVYYEFSIDDSKYTKKSTVNKYVFDDLKQGTHKIRVRVTNEVGKTKTSKNYNFETDISNITCIEKDNSSYVQSEKNIVCKYPSGDNYIYEYSENNVDWNQIGLTNNEYNFNFKENKTIYTRIVRNNKIVKTESINVNNIDNVLNDAIPILSSNMIPVIYDENKKEWVKTDPKQIYWNYKDKIWANAVLVNRYAIEGDKNSKSRKYYLSEESIGKTVYEKDIIGFYVWIPSYKYILFNVNRIGKEKTISISFEKSNLENKTETYSNGQWYMHPAFIDNGFWVSKFESSAPEKTECYNDNSVYSCNKENIIIYSLPNKNSLKNISISNAHLIALNMTKKGNIYGLDNINSHVITNLEWGAIAYLTNSKYGINTNLYRSSDDYKTNLTASTTGNITGVFDMAGKNIEMVMANYNKDAGKDKKDNSGFKDFGNVDWPNYIDYYKGITSKSRIIGDATGETEKWYDSQNEFVNGEKPFMIRGGVMNNISSIYNFSNSTGSPNENTTFRVVLK